jgi:hypothetical protein
MPHNEGPKWKMNRRWFRAPTAAAPGRSPLPWTTCRGRYRRWKSTYRHAAALEKSENNKWGSYSLAWQRTSSEDQQDERHRCCGHRRANPRGRRRCSLTEPEESGCCLPATNPRPSVAAKPKNSSDRTLGEPARRDRQPRATGHRWAAITVISKWPLKRQRCLAGALSQSPRSHRESRPTTSMTPRWHRSAHCSLT